MLQYFVLNSCIINRYYLDKILYSLKSKGYTSVRPQNRKYSILIGLLHYTHVGHIICFGWL